MMGTVPMMQLNKEERVVPKRQTAGNGGTQSSGPLRLRAKVAELPKGQGLRALELGPTNDQVGRLWNARSRASTPEGRLDRPSPGSIPCSGHRPCGSRVGMGVAGEGASVATQPRAMGPRNQEAGPFGELVSE